MIQGWEFIKEKKKVRKQENTHSFKKKKTFSRKKELAQENTLSTKKASKKKWIRSRKNDNVQEKYLSTSFFCLLKMQIPDLTYMTDWGY